MSRAEMEDGREGRRVTWIGVGANALLIVVKFVAGVLGHSQALIADAVHSVSDFFTDAVVLLGLWYGRRPPDEDHHFGHARIETMASAVVGFSLITVALYLGYRSAMNIYLHGNMHPTYPALIGAAVSIAVKEALYQYTAIVGKRIRSEAVIANAWHHRSDALSSVAVLIGVGGAVINPGWYILDAYAALLVSFFIAKVGIDVLWKALREMADTAPRKSNRASRLGDLAQLRASARGPTCRTAYCVGPRASVDRRGCTADCSTRGGENATWKATPIWVSSSAVSST